MGLTRLNFDGKNKVEVAIMRLREFEPLTKGQGFYFADSYGKDSCVIDRLLDMAGVKHDAHYSQGGIDPPQLVSFGREYHPNTAIERPEMSMWKGIMKHGMPYRQVRWCCELIKEKNGNGRYVITGIRWEESSQRKTRRMVEICTKDKTKTFVHPIIDWTHQEVWEFINQENIPYCSLYDLRNSNRQLIIRRIGCVLCPMKSPSETKLDCILYPKIVEAWHRACIRRFNDRQDLEFYQKFKDAETYWQWWLSRKGEPKINEAQCIMLDN